MSTKFYKTSPQDPYEVDIVVPKDTDFVILVTSIENDEDCDPSTDTPFDYTGSTIVLEVFEHSSDDTPVFTQPDGDWTVTQNADGAAVGKNNQIKTTLDYTDLEAVPLNLLQQYWYRVHITDAAGLPYTLFRGNFQLDNK